MIVYTYIRVPMDCYQGEGYEILVSGPFIKITDGGGGAACGGGGGDSGGGGGGVTALQSFPRC